MSPHSLIHVSNAVPFAGALYHWLEFHQHPLENLAKESRRYEQPFLAWELVRKNKNPFFAEGTGFEGYFIGVCCSTDEVLARLLEVGQRILTSIAREYRREPHFQARLMKTLSGEMYDAKAADIWDAELGATIARLRCNLFHNPKGDQFRLETYRLTRSLPDIRYVENGREVWQEYWLGYHQPNRNPVVNLHSLKPSEQAAWLVVWSIGRFGHPLLRSLLVHQRQQVFRHLW